MGSFVGRIGGRASGGMNADEFKRACHVTAAHFVTLDFVMLTDERQLWTRGFHLEDRVRGDSIKIFSLIELEPGVHYSTGHGNSLVRTSVREAPCHHVQLRFGRNPKPKPSQKNLKID